MSKKIVCIGVALFMCLGLFSACKSNKIVREKMSESWWDGKVEVSVIFPENVKQGESFEIKVITINLLNEDITGGRPTCCAGKGVLITSIKHRTKANYYLNHWHLHGHDDGIATEAIPVGGQIEAVWAFEGKGCYNLAPGSAYNVDTALKGLYDVYLGNGEVFRNAIKIN